MGRLSDPPLQRGAAGARRTDSTARQRAPRRRRGCPRPCHGCDCQCRVRCARRTGSRSADHARQPDRSDGLGLMTTLDILSGGAAQGLVASLAPTFTELTGYEIAGEFGAVGAMADKLREGARAYIVILTAAIVGKLAEENWVVPASISNIGLVETAIAVRAGDRLITASDAAGLRAAFLGGDAIFVPHTKA